MTKAEMVDEIIAILKRLDGRVKPDDITGFTPERFNPDSVLAPELSTQGTASMNTVP